MAEPLSEHVLQALRGLSWCTYMQLSASEAGDPEIQKFIEDGYAEAYFGGGMIWHLTRKGRELAVELGLLKNPDQLIIEAATGELKRVP